MPIVFNLIHCTRDRDQDHPQEKEMQKDKTVVRGGRPYKQLRKEEKGKAKEKSKDISI